MSHFALKELGEKIKEIFLTQEKYKMAKHIQEFTNGDKFLGDYWTFYVFEQPENLPPTFYSVLTPYDVVSKKAPEQALVFRDGKVILNIDFLEYVNMRTGIMDSLVLKSLGERSLAEKKVLYIGTGKVAKTSLKALKEFFADLSVVSAMTRKERDNEFIQFAKEMEVDVQFVAKDKISDYDYIFCHTPSGAGNVLGPSEKEKIKKGAVITTFVSTTSDAELAEELYDSSVANIFIDWEESIDGTKELKAAIEKGKVSKENLYTVEQLFRNDFTLNNDAKYTIYRSTGTPMQNLAVLKLLLNNE